MIFVARDVQRAPAWGKLTRMTAFLFGGDGRYGSQRSTSGATRNLPLAARVCVGHIDLIGAVAEWLKAAVC
jgi:hypothetical protein